MSYLSSEQVKIYPSARRGATKAFSRLLSEEAMTRLINSLIEYEGFVITSDSSVASQSDTLFKFNLKGYYFEVDKNALQNLFPISSNSNIYANITLTKYGEFWELDGQDAPNDVYQGVNFTNTSQASEQDNIYSLLLFTKSGNSWVVPPESRRKFNISTQISDIDGGVL